jgi:O-acetyl-ADP-ribose deacetylase (regulator of RNase III)
MEIYLIDIDKKITDAWQRVFEGVGNIKIIHDSIFNYPADALVSPANSFGFMNGGIDFAISKNLGWHIEKKLQKIIREKHFGELLVGQAEIVETDHKDFPYLISAPTMRTPMTILRSPNVYLAMKAILVLIKEKTFDDGLFIRDKVKTIAISGLGTGVGQVPPLVAARQMRIAWEDVVNEKYKTEEGWEEMRSNYAYFFTHDEKDLKYNIV